MATDRAPKWAHSRHSAQDISKAARIMALYLMRAEIADVPKTHLAAALGISRWTLDRDLATLPEVEEHIEKIKRMLSAAA